MILALTTANKKHSQSNLIGIETGYIYPGKFIALNSQSNLIGIETNSPRAASPSGPPLNRTLLELKRGWKGKKKVGILALNRTLLELKPI